MQLVSVCIPVYNAEKYIGAAIESVLKQTYPSIEIIVVNDGSTDSTETELRKFNSEKLKVVRQANKGQCAAANLAFAHSRGDYIKFFDADDLLSPDFIQAQINRLDGSKEVVASAAWGRFQGDDIQSFQLNPEPVWRDMKPIDWIVESLKDGHNMMQCALWLIPRRVLEKSGLWNERLSLINDYDFFIRVLLASKEVRFCEEAVLYYRSAVSQSLSSQTSRKAMESAWLSIDLGNTAILKAEDSVRTRNICAGTYKLWMYAFYPYHMDLYRLAKEKVEMLGGTTVSFSYGGATRHLSNLLGWRTVKQLKRKLGKHA